MTDINFPQDFYLDDVGVWRLKKEKLAELEKPKQMTNEEYIKSLNTEQLAEELLAWWFDGANTYSHFGLFQSEIDEAKEKIMKWLKQPHNSPK